MAKTAESLHIQPQAAKSKTHLSLASHHEPELCSTRLVHMLHTQRFNIDQSYIELREGVKHHGYEIIADVGERFYKNVWEYLTTYRKLLGDSVSKQDLSEHQAYLDDVLKYIKDLKRISKSYKKNEIFNHTSELRRIMENEDARMVELEQLTRSIQFLA